MHRLFLLSPLLLATAAGCARVAIEGGEKPVHIVMDVNVRVARELDQFFAFEEKHAATTQATQPAAPSPVAAHQ